MELRDPAEGPSSAWLGAFARTLTPALSAELRGWLLLGLGSLAVAGGIALLLALARAPGAPAALTSPEVFRAGLVIHVDLAFVVWYLALLGVMATLAAARSSGGVPRMARLGRYGLWLATAGTLLLIATPFLGDAPPSLNNYVPVLVHPAYYVGLAAVGLGVALPVVRLLGNSARHTEPFVFGTLVAGLCHLIALLCFAFGWALLPTGIGLDMANERVFWGGGHVLQFVNTALLLTALHGLSNIALGDGPVGPGLFRVALGTLLLFALPAPLFMVTLDLSGLAHRQAFTDLFWYGLPLPSLAIGLGLARLLGKGRPPWRAPAFLGLAWALLLFGVGGVFGFFLGVSDTRTPAHYHAVVTGVNLALIGLLFSMVLPLLGRALRGGWAVRLQFVFYGAGMLLFAAGMFVAGAAGVPRKTAGVEQGLDSLWKTIGMGMTGLGGALAVLGGVMFVWLALAAALRREAPHG